MQRFQVQGQCNQEQNHKFASGAYVWVQPSLGNNQRLSETAMPHPIKLRKYKSVRFCGCKVVRLQNITYICISYNNKVSFMSIFQTNPQVNYGLPFLPVFCAVTQPHNHITALQMYYAVDKPHNYTNVKPHNFTVLHLCGCIFVQHNNHFYLLSLNHTTVQQCGYVVMQPHCLTNARLHRRKPVRSCNHTLLQPHSRIAAQLSDRKNTHSHCYII